MQSRGGIIGLGLCAWISFSASGCGVLLQTAFGWDETETRSARESHAVEISTHPPNAVVTRHSSRGPEVIGTAPLVDFHEVEVETTYSDAKTAGLWIGGLAELGGGVALIARAASSGGRSWTETNGFRDSTSTQNASPTPVLSAIGASFLLLGALTDITVALIHGGVGERLSSKRVAPNALEYTYSASLPGRADAPRTGHSSERSRIELRLDELPAAAIAQAAAAQKAPVQAELAATSAVAAIAQPGPTRGRKLDVNTVVAVMPVADMSGNDVRRALDPVLVESLGRQLRVFVARERVRVTEVGAEDRLLKAQIDELKTASYRSCYDETCQIELGKALAASHILRSNIARFGNVCVLNAELIDLASEVSVAAASARGACEEEGFLQMGETVAARLVEDR